jgi:hypothetical protein
MLVLKRNLLTSKKPRNINFEFLKKFSQKDVQKIKKEEDIQRNKLKNDFCAIVLLWL